MTISKKIYKLVAVTAVAAMALTGAALATNDVDFSVECPKLRGSVSTLDKPYEIYGEKEITGSSLYVYNCGVGGGYQVDARQIDSDGAAGAWEAGYRTGIAGMYLDGTSRIRAGDKVGIEFRSPITNLYDVEVTGTFDTN
ncbi:MAG: hypothetical protein SOY13_08240 [Pseudoflavonifractor sp.]|nr:hypothetical protein [Pseudoflavonifractor sp.]